MITTTEDYTITIGSVVVELSAYMSYADSTSQLYISSGRLRVDVASAVGFPEEVFVWEKYRTTFAQKDPTLTIRPVCVAKPSDLELPIGEIDDVPADGSLPYFLLSYLSMDVASPTILLDTWAHIKQDVTSLVRTTMGLGGPPA